MVSLGASPEEQEPPVGFTLQRNEGRAERESVFLWIPGASIPVLVGEFRGECWSLKQSAFLASKLDSFQQYANTSGPKVLPDCLGSDQVTMYAVSPDVLALVEAHVVQMVNPANITITNFQFKVYSNTGSSWVEAGGSLNNLPVSIDDVRVMQTTQTVFKQLLVGGYVDPISVSV